MKLFLIKALRTGIWAALSLLLFAAHAAASGGAGCEGLAGGRASHAVERALHPVFVVPFAGVLLCIAVIPLVNAVWWHENFPKVAAFWGVPMAVTMFALLPGRAAHTLVEYLSFMALVGSLFTISGGIMVRGAFKDSALVNTCFLASGALMASLIGTAGASMVLVRPMLRENMARKYKTHVFVFFIFIVSNIGGALTPLGDPPLFLGFLQGVPFAWTLKHMLPGWALNVGVLLAVFFAVDSYFFSREPRLEHTETRSGKFGISGAINFVFLGGVLAAALMYGNVFKPLFGAVPFLPELCQMAFMLCMATLSYRLTPAELHEENGFSWFPIKEVGIIFAAIFACMIPALKILEELGRSGSLAVTHDWQFFWMTGVLSSFLDNAPTYMTFLSLGKTLCGAGCVPVYGGCVPQNILLAISMGAVFMGANTYIGNAPNFMVKSIADHSGVRMPSFVGYILWSAAVLIPLFIINTFVFFRG